MRSRQRARGCWATASRRPGRTVSRCCSCTRRIFQEPWWNWSRAEMHLATALAIFFLIWWLVLFAVLPWGVHRQDEDGAIPPGTDPGAPALPDLRRKLLWTTLVSLAIFAGCYVVYAER